MATVLNQGLGFDEVRWATTRRGSYDSLASFDGKPEKRKLPAGTKLFRLMRMAAGSYFDGVWWMPEAVFTELQRDANQSSHGGGRLFRNYVAQYMALPSGSYQLSVAEIELTQAVFGWVGCSAPLFGRPGGMEQIFLPNLHDKGSPRTSQFARLVHTYWLKF
jgi:hypothetical protein